MCRDKVCIVCPIKEIKPVHHSQRNELWNEWWLAEQAGARTKAYANCSTYLKTVLLPDHQFIVHFSCSWTAFVLGSQVNRRRSSIPRAFLAFWSRNCLQEQEGGKRKMGGQGCAGAVWWHLWQCPAWGSFSDVCAAEHVPPWARPPLGEMHPAPKCGMWRGCLLCPSVPDIRS